MSVDVENVVLVMSAPSSTSFSLWFEASVVVVLLIIGSQISFG